MIWFWLHGFGVEQLLNHVFDLAVSNPFAQQWIIVGNVELGKPELFPKLTLIGGQLV